MNHCLKRLLCCMLVFALCLSFVPASASLAEEGRRVVRVGYYTAPGFQEYDEVTGEYSGSGYEYLLALAQYANWEYEFVPVGFSQGVTLLGQGQLDLMNNVSITAERQQVLAFSDYASGSNYGCLIVDADNEVYAFNDYTTFSQMRVGLVAGSIYLPYFEEFCREHQISAQIITYESEALMRAGLEKGEIDARVVSSSYNDGSREVAHFAPMSYYFAVPAGQTALLQELNDAMVALQTDMPDLSHTLADKYASTLVDETPVLSAAEKQYVAQHPVVTVAISGAWYPIFYLDAQGELCGPLATIYRAISKATGLTFEPVRYNSYSDSLKAIQSCEVDAIVEFPYDYLYANKWNVVLTEQINSIETYCIMNESMQMEDIKTIAFHGEPYMESLVKQRFGQQARYVAYASVDEAVDAVLAGEADAAFANYYTATKFQNQGRYLSLKYVLIPSLAYPFAIGISRTSDACLKSLLTKGLHTITNDTIEGMFRNAAVNSSSPDALLQFYRNPAMFLTTAIVMTALAVLLLAFIFYSHRIRKSNAQLAAANEAKSRFLSRMSHDMRTPMNGILGLVTLMQDKEAPKEIKDDLRQIQMSGKYLLNLINDTLDVNKIEANRLELHPVPTDTEKLVANICQNAHALADEKHVTLSVQKVNAESMTPTLLLLDEGRVEQLFMNLVSNAVKFTPAGGQVNVTMERLETTDAYVVNRYRIKDTGIGMSREFMQHMFEPFAQEGRAETDRENGTGLGLSIVHTLVQLMGGEMQVESEVGKGTAFTVTLRFPRYNGPAIKEEKPADNEAQNRLLDGKRVLLCEDHPLNRQIAVKMLEKKHIRVDTAENGQLGCQMFENAPAGTYDLILMDIRMPMMDGLAATRTIRGMLRPDAKTIPIVAMTANAYDEDVQHCKQAGMNDHIAKPVDVQRLYQVIAEQIGKGTKA